MATLGKVDIRGLHNFITEIRACKSKEAEERRINKELAHIRSKFKSEKAIKGYDKKKYVCKLLYMFLLGVNIDFGYIEAVSLLASKVFSEKQIGYVFLSAMLNENSELTRLIIQSIKNDLRDRNELFVSLALQCCANIGGKEMAEALAPDVQKLLGTRAAGRVGGARAPTPRLPMRRAEARALCALRRGAVASDSTTFVKKKAALTLLRLYRKAPEILPSGEWTGRIVALLDDRDLGVLSCATSLVTALA